MFLGVFNQESWIPIDIGAITKNNAIFQNIEPNLIYQPLYNKNGYMCPAAHPFLYTGNEIKYFIPDLKNKDFVTLKRKYPVRFYTVNSLNRNVRGAKIIGSSDSFFKNSEIIFEIKDTITTNRNVITLLKAKKYRYIRYVSPEGKPIELAEFCVYDVNNNFVPLKITESISPIHTNNKFALKNIIDNDPLTFTQSKDTSCYLTFDLEKNIPICQVMFIPRNDENFIWPGDRYELFYNDGINNWQSLGKQIAESNELKYYVPNGALFWLRNLTRGKEEHVFYIEKGKQIFVADIKPIEK